MAESREPGPDAIDEFMLFVTAYLTAQRRLLIHLVTRDLADTPEPLRAARALRRQFAGAPTQPRHGGGLDPATSDMLAAMTDEAIDDLLRRVEQRLQDGRAASPRPGAVGAGDVPAPGRNTASPA